MEAERGEGGVLAQKHLQQQHRPAQHQRQQDVDWEQRRLSDLQTDMQVMIHLDFVDIYLIWTFKRLVSSTVSPAGLEVLPLWA